MTMLKQHLAEGYDGNNALRCPGCGCENLHHYQVDVFCREKEDAPRGVHAMVRPSGAVVKSDMKFNPSSRRDGLVVSFFCEQCDVISVMTIVQHKGTTYLQLLPTLATSADIGSIQNVT